MSEHAEGSSHTISSGSTRDHAHVQGTQAALEVVEQYRRSEISRAGALLAIQSALSAGEVDDPQAALAEALPTYLTMLVNVDSVNFSGQQGKEPQQTNHQVVARESAESGESRRSRGCSGVASRSRGRPRASAVSSREEGDEPKRRRSSVNEELFPWRGSSSVLRQSVEPELQQILDLLEDWAADPTYVVRKILLSPVCPEFPPDQWLNVVKGQAVDLSKVLGAYYSSDVDTKRFRSHGDWIIAFGKTIQATSFALPGRFSDYVEYQNFILGLFTSIQPCYHKRIIELDKAIRLRAANQKYLRLNDFARFEDLRTIFLSSYGVGSSSGEGSASRGNRGNDNLPILDGETPVITGIEAPVTDQHLNAHTSMSVTVVGAEELTGGRTAQSQNLNQQLSEGPRFRRHMIWNSKTGVRSRTVQWTEFAVYYFSSEAHASAVLIASRVTYQWPGFSWLLISVPHPWLNINAN